MSSLGEEKNAHIQPQRVYRNLVKKAETFFINAEAYQSTTESTVLQNNYLD